MSSRSKIRTKLQAFKPVDAPWPGKLGDGQGNVIVPNNPNLRYVRPVGSGEPLIVEAGDVPDVENYPVWVGHDVYDKKTIRVLGRRRIKGVEYPSGVAAHAPSHYADGADPIYIDTTQIVPTLVFPYSGMTCLINSGWVFVGGKPVKVIRQTIDLTSHIPVSGARYSLVRIDSSGSASIQDGGTVASWMDLTPADIPTVASGHIYLAFVRLYAGQTTLSKDVKDPDITDVRYSPRAPSSGGGGGGDFGSGILRYDYSDSIVYTYDQTPEGMTQALAEAETDDTVMFNCILSGNFSVPPDITLAGQSLWGAKINGQLNLLGGTSLTGFQVNRTVPSGSACPIIQSGSGISVVDMCVFVADQEGWEGGDSETVRLADPNAVIKISNSYLRAFSANPSAKASIFNFSVDSTGIAEVHFCDLDNVDLTVLSENFRIYSGSGIVRAYGCVWTPGSDYSGITQREGDRAKTSHQHAFVDLSDVTQTYVGASRKFVAVREWEDGLEFVDAPSGSSSGGGHIIQWSGSSLDQRAKLNFTGSVTVTNTDSETTTVDITGGPSGSSVEDLVEAKGDLLVGSGPGVLARLPVGGINGYVLTVNSGSELGVSWERSTGYVDQSEGSGGTYGILTGVINGSNTDFTVSQGSYVSGSLQVFLNGVFQALSSSGDWQELDPLSGTFRFLTAPETGDLITVIYGKSNSPETIAHHQGMFYVFGTLTVAAGAVKGANHLGRTLRLLGVYLDVATAPTGADLIVDLHKNGTTVFSTQSNRPRIVAGAYSGYSTVLDVASWADGEYLTADIDQVGSTVAGSDLSVTIVYA